MIGTISKITAILKIGGITLFAVAAFWSVGISFDTVSSVSSRETSLSGFFAGVSLAILAYKGFTKITNSGDEVKEPNKNVGRAIMISLVICAVVYMLVTLSVTSALNDEEIISAKHYL